MVRIFRKVCMELGYFFLFLQEQIKDIIIILSKPTYPDIQALTSAFTDTQSFQSHSLSLALPTCFEVYHSPLKTGFAGMCQSTLSIEDDSRVTDSGPTAKV
jgi:hypothetical protein